MKKDRIGKEEEAKNNTVMRLMLIEQENNCRESVLFRDQVRERGKVNRK